jgi:hypothetical protein
VACTPRRTGLPARATAGIECRVDTALVDRVGVYGFNGDDDILSVYFDRLARYGVLPRTGACRRGAVGDRSWPDYLPDEAVDGGYSPLRSGCFIDENGIANVRVICYASIYIGILGKDADVAALSEWAWDVAAGESSDRDPPGICAAPD